MMFYSIDHNTIALESLSDKKSAIGTIPDKELLLENKTNISRNFNHVSFEDKEDTDSSSVLQQVLEESLNIEETSENTIVQRQSFEESKETTLPSMSYK